MTPSGSGGARAAVQRGEEEEIRGRLTDGTQTRVLGTRARPYLVHYKAQTLPRTGTVL
jgi:hypothetical protein